MYQVPPVSKDGTGGAECQGKKVVRFGGFARGRLRRGCQVLSMSEVDAGEAMGHGTPVFFSIIYKFSIMFCSINSLLASGGAGRPH